MVQTIHPPQSLPPKLIAAWERTLLSQARLPRGTSRKDEDSGALLDMVVKGEQRAVLDLWEIFTQERRELRRQLLAHKREAVAYLLGFHLPNAARMALALDRMQERKALAELLASSPGLWRWHDLGCGTGALAHAALNHLAKTGFDLRGLELHLTDASGVLLDMARALFEEVEGAPEPKTRKLALEDLPANKFEHAAGVGGSVYSLGYVWNELAKNRAAQSKLKKIWQGHVDRGESALIFMIEPATQDMCRASMQWRDDMVALGWKPLYPCPSATPCPMLQRSRDWCYSEASWRRPRAILQLDKYLELDRSQISATIFVMASPALAAVAQVEGRGAAVAVGRPSRTDDYGFDYLVCLGDELEKRAPERGAPMALRGQLALPPARVRSTPQPAGRSAAPAPRRDSRPQRDSARPPIKKAIGTGPSKRPSKPRRAR